MAGICSTATATASTVSVPIEVLGNGVDRRQSDDGTIMLMTPLQSDQVDDGGRPLPDAARGPR
jgi:hypothetical protein